MALTFTARVGVPQWTDPADHPARADFDTGFANIEDRVVVAEAPGAGAPAVAAGVVNRLYLDETSGVVYIDDGANWRAVGAAMGVVGDIHASAPGDAAAAGATGKAADAGHVHAREQWGVDANISTSHPGDLAAAGAAGRVADAAHRHVREAWGAAGDIAASVPGNVAAAGGSGKVADASHVHAREGAPVVGDVTNSAPGDARAVGASGHVADAAHRHGREAAPTAADLGAVPLAGGVAMTGVLTFTSGWSDADLAMLAWTG